MPRSELREDFGCEVQSGGRGGYRAFNAAVYGLVVAGVAFLRGTVEVRRYRYLAQSVDKLRECYLRVVPAEVYYRSVVDFHASLGFERGAQAGAGEFRVCLRAIVCCCLQSTASCRPK